MDDIFRKKVIAITLATGLLTTGAVYKSGANEKLPAFEYDYFLNNYKIVEFEDHFDVYQKTNTVPVYVRSFGTQQDAKEYINNQADIDCDEHKSFSENFRKLYIGGVAGLSALASTCFVNVVVPPRKRKRR